MSKKEINNLSDRIVEAINNTTNDYDARDEVIKILIKILWKQKNNMGTLLD